MADNGGVIRIDGVGEFKAPPGFFNLSPSEQADEVDALGESVMNFRKQQEDKQVTAIGAAKAAGSGAATGAIGTAGLPGDVRSGVEALAKKAGISPEVTQTFLQTLPILGPALASGPTSGDIRGAVEGVTGPLSYEPKNTAEKYIQNVATFAPAAMAGPGGIVRKAVEQAVLPGIASQAAGDLTEGTAAEPYARAAAAIATPIVTGRIVTPLKVPKSREDSVNILKKEGVDITAGQKTGSKFLRKQEEELGGSTAEAIAQRQAEQFTAAVLKRVGEDAPRATTEVVNGAFERIGGQMNKLAAANPLTVDAKLNNDVKAAQAEYNRLVSPSNRAPAIEQITDDILHPVAKDLDGGTIMGDQYQAMRSQLGRDARAARNDPNLQKALYGIQTALDDAAERSIKALNPDMLGQWSEARGQYKNLLAVEKAINYSGENAAGGIITPQNLARAVKSMGGTRDYSRGRTDLSVLARAGSEVMAPLANSNTASRMRASLFLHGLGGAAGAAFGYGSGLSPSEIAGAAITGAVVPRAIGEGLIRGRRYLGNTALGERQTLGANVTRGLLSGFGQ